MPREMRALWEEQPDHRENPRTYWMMYLATRVGDLDLVFEILEQIGLGRRLPVVRGRLVAHPRFIRVPPAGCARIRASSYC